MFSDRCNVQNLGPLVSRSNAKGAYEYKGILQTHLLPFQESGDSSTFQHDSASIHTAKLIKDFLT